MSTILYENPSLTVFLVDIPASISAAQHITGRRCPPGYNDKDNANGNDSNKYRNTNSGRFLLSSSPLLDPYPNQPEPKTAKARARVLERIPDSERSFYEAANPHISSALEDIRKNCQGDWCRQRRVLDEALQHERERKRKKTPEPRAAENQNSIGQETRNSSTLSSGKEPVLTDSADGSLSRRLSEGEPPLVLSPSINLFSSLSEVQDTLVKNTSSSQAVIQITPGNAQETRKKRLRGRDAHKSQDISTPTQESISFIIPPKCAFILSSIPEPSNRQATGQSPIPTLSPSTKFNFILLDPPWPNRSVSRSKKYPTKSSRPTLESQLGNIIKAYIDPNYGIVGIWVTNSAAIRSIAHGALCSAGLRPFEEWIWAKTTVKGKPVLPLDGLWRKPYEVLILGRREDAKDSKSGKEPDVKRRVIAAVPDVHSRKPNLKELVEKIFFSSPGAAGDGKTASEDTEECGISEYSALEVFARNLTAGWTACGNEVLRFNWDGWWV